jgi:hypothetical protein
VIAFVRPIKKLGLDFHGILTLSLCSARGVEREFSLDSKRHILKIGFSKLRIQRKVVLSFGAFYLTFGP